MINKIDGVVDNIKLPEKDDDVKKTAINGMISSLESTKELILYPTRSLLHQEKKTLTS